MSGLSDEVREEWADAIRAVPFANADGHGCAHRIYGPCAGCMADALAPLIHQAEARGAAAVVPLFRVAAELVVQDVRAQRGDHIASLVEDSFAVHFDRAAALTQDEQP